MLACLHPFPFDEKLALTPRLKSRLRREHKPSVTRRIDFGNCSRRFALLETILVGDRLRIVDVAPAPCYKLLRLTRRLGGRAARTRPFVERGGQLDERRIEAEGMQRGWTRATVEEKVAFAARSARFHIFARLRLLVDRLARRHTVFEAMRTRPVALGRLRELGVILKAKKRSKLSLILATHIEVTILNTRRIRKLAEQSLHIHVFCSQLCLSFSTLNSKKKWQR